MKLIDIIEENEQDKQQLIDYAKFVFEHFLQKGDFVEHGGYYFKWFIPTELFNDKNVEFSVDHNGKPFISISYAHVFYEDVFVGQKNGSLVFADGNLQGIDYLERRLNKILHDICKQHNLGYVIDVTIFCKPIKHYSQMSLLGMLKEEQSKRDQIIEYSKFIFKNFLQQGSAKIISSKFNNLYNWYIDEETVDFTPNAYFATRTEHEPAIQISKGINIEYDPENTKVVLIDGIYYLKYTNPITGELNHDGFDSLIQHLSRKLIKLGEEHNLVVNISPNNLYISHEHNNRGVIDFREIEK